MSHSSVLCSARSSLSARAILTTHRSAKVLPNTTRSCSDNERKCQQKGRRNRLRTMNRRERTIGSASNGNVDNDNDYYEILNVSETATKQDIKKAYRKKALETHPDRNKKKNANEEFNLCKRAYTVLSDEDNRKEYDRKRRFYRESSSSSSSRTSGWSKSTGNSSSTTSTKTPSQSKKEEEEFYGFSDFFRDIEKEFEQKRTMNEKNRDPTKPKSLWEELEFIGEEFVEFLEENEKVVYEKIKNNEVEREFTTPPKNSNTNGGSSVRANAEKMPKKNDESVEDMLNALKRKMGK